MLQQGPHEEADTPAAQVRVKSEELAKALAAIEARRQEEARRLEGTIALGDAVQDLQLDATPEEILAEVNAQRERPLEETAVEQTLLPVFGMTAKILGALIGAFLVLAWLMSLATTPSTVAPLNPPNGTTWPVPLVNSPPFTPTGPLSPTPTGKFGGLYQPDATLSNLPDDLSFSCDALAARDIIRGYFPSQKIMPGPPYPGQIGWKFIKHDKRIYMRGWVPKQYTHSLGSGSLVHVYNSPTTYGLSLKPRRITLPVDKSTFQGLYMRAEPSGVDGFERLDEHALLTGPGQIILSGVHPDSHIWEKWR